MASSATVMVPTAPRKSNLQLLYESTPLVVALTPFKANDYPNCLFWTERAWVEWAREGKEMGIFRSGVEGEGVNSSWLEDPNGRRVDVVVQRNILDEARRTWSLMRRCRVRFGAYKATLLPELDYFRKSMEGAFEELRMCENHWKVDQLWTENYSSWANTRRQAKQPQRGDDETPRLATKRKL